VVFIQIINFHSGQNIYQQPCSGTAFQVNLLVPNSLGVSALTKMKLVTSEIVD